MTVLMPAGSLLQGLADGVPLDPAGATHHRAGLEGTAPHRGYDRLTAASLAALTRINAKVRRSHACQQRTTDLRREEA